MIRIAAATRADVPIILEMIRALAVYEKLEHACVATEDDLSRSLFDARPAAEVLIAWHGVEPAGFALFFHNYSTFLARRGLYLEDLFVKPHYRGAGIGKALLVRLAQIALERQCGRFEWSVLDWNAAAIGFYRKLGAIPLEDWTIFRVTGDALTRLARTADGAESPQGFS